MKKIKKSPPLSFLGFTLTELIVVITILAILGTIGFLSIAGYSSKTRDTNRISSLGLIQRGLEVAVVETGYYPTPDATVNTGSVNGIVFSNKGFVKASVVKAIKMDKIPKDPLSGNEFVYATTPERTKYQIATTFEGLSSMTTPQDISNFLVSKAYAANSSLQRARVNGNYLGFYKYASGSSQYVINAPSLIYANSGSVNLIFSVTGALVSPDTTIAFVVNQGENLPYNLSGNTSGMVGANTVLQSTTGVNTAVLQTVDITGVTKATLANVFTGATLSNFGGSLPQVEAVVLGTSTSTGSTTTPTGLAGATASGISTTGITWNWNAVSGSTRYETSTNGTTWTNQGNTLSFTEISLTCGTSYTRYVRACNAVGCGSSVALTSVSTSPCPINCSYNTYNGSCTASCGGGNYQTYYTKTVVESNGGTCPISQGQYAGPGGSCNTQSCCTPNGSYTYGSCDSNSCGTNCNRAKYDSCGTYVGVDTYYNGSCCTPNGSYSYSSCSVTACGQTGTRYQYDSCGNYAGTVSCSTASCS